MFTGLCARFVAELGLNRDIADVAARLLAAHESDGLRAHGGPERGSVLRGVTRSRLPAAPPHVHAMAYVVAAINLLHGLAGGGDVDDADDAPGWRGRRTEARRAGRNATPATRRGRRSLPEKNGSLPVNGPAASERKLTIDPPRGGWVAWAERTMREGASAPRLPARVAEAATRTTAAATTTTTTDDDWSFWSLSPRERRRVSGVLQVARASRLGGRASRGAQADGGRALADTRRARRRRPLRRTPRSAAADGGSRAGPQPGDSSRLDSPGAAGRVDLDASSRRTAPSTRTSRAHVSTASVRPRVRRREAADFGPRS